MGADQDVGDVVLGIEAGLVLLVVGGNLVRGGIDAVDDLGLDPAHGEVEPLVAGELVDGEALLGQRGVQGGGAAEALAGVGKRSLDVTVLDRDAQRACFVHHRLLLDELGQDLDPGIDPVQVGLRTLEQRRELRLGGHDPELGDHGVLGDLRPADHGCRRCEVGAEATVAGRQRQPHRYGEQQEAATGGRPRSGGARAAAKESHAYARLLTFSRPRSVASTQATRSLPGAGMMRVPVTGL